jgi:ketosteroid isomerase-like protein
MSRQNLEILTRCAELLNVGDWDALFEMYDADVQVEFRDLWPVPDTPEVLRGREAFRGVVAHWSEPYEEFGAEVYEYLDADPWVICDTRWHRKARGAEVPVDVHFADAYEVKDGKITRAILGCPSVAAALKATGAGEED